MSVARSVMTSRRGRCFGICLVSMLLQAPASAASAATLTAKDAQIIAKAIGFLDPAPAGGVVAIAYDPAQPASKADADAIVALFSSGLSAGGGTLSAKTVPTNVLGDGSGFVALIAAQSASGSAVMQTASAHHIPCITADLAAVQSGGCVMSVQTDPKVDISVNHATAQQAGISFQSAFRMLIHEI